MRRYILYLSLALITLDIGVSISDFGECNRPFGPTCCGGVGPHSYARPEPILPPKVETRAVEMLDSCPRNQRSANGIEPTTTIVISVIGRDGGNTFRVKCK